MKVNIQKKPALLAIMLLMLIPVISIDIYLPIFPILKNAFNTSEQGIQGTISLYFLGIAVSQLLIGPFIDKLRFRNCVIASLLIYAGSSLLIGLSNDSLFQFYIGRVIQGIAAGAIAVISRASIPKIFPKNEAPKIFLIVLPVVAMSPIVAPILGASLSMSTNWNFIFYALSIFAILSSLMVFFYFYPDENTSTADSKNKTTNANWLNIRAAYKALITSRQFLSSLSIVCGVYFIFYAYIAESPFLFSGFGYSTKKLSFIYVTLAVGFLIGSFSARKIIGRWKLQTILNIGFVTFLISVLSICISIALSSHFEDLIILACTILMGIGNGILVPIGFSRCITAIDDFPGLSASLSGSCSLLFAALGSYIFKSLSGGSPTIFGITVMLASAIVVALQIILNK